MPLQTFLHSLFVCLYVASALEQQRDNPYPLVWHPSSKVCRHERKKPYIKKDGTTQKSEKKKEVCIASANYFWSGILARQQIKEHNLVGPICVWCMGRRRTSSQLNVSSCPEDCAILEGLKSRMNPWLLWSLYAESAFWSCDISQTFSSPLPFLWDFAVLIEFHGGLGGILIINVQCLTGNLNRRLRSVWKLMCLI